MRTYLLLLLSLIVGSAAVNASDMPPTPRITLDSPARSELIGYTGETLTFSSSTSSANCGTINQRRWRLDSGSYVYATNFTHTFTLPAGVYEKTYTLELRTRNTCNLYKTETKTITIRRDKRVYFVKDHLGSVRATVNEAGDVISHDDYYPFGLTMPSRSSNTANPNDNYKFTGHERDDEAGIMIDYMNARNYDPIIGRFLQIDPYAVKFPDLSPYSYAFNNPLRFIDPDGRAPTPPDIIVLNDDSGASGFGHNAVLVGNDNDGWIYYSKDGPDKYTKTTFATLDDALSSDDVERYDTGVRFETTAEQDEAAKAELDVAVTEEYSFTKSNCADLCNIGLKAGEVSIDDKAMKTAGITHPDKQSRVLGKKEGVTEINIQTERKRIEKEKEKDGN